MVIHQENINKATQDNHQHWNELTETCQHNSINEQL